MWSPQVLQDEARRVIFEAVTRHTITVGPSRSVPTEEFTHGSGVCVEYEGRPFIVTARHVVDNLEALGFSPGQFAVGSRSTKPLKVNFTGVIPERIRGVDHNETRTMPFNGVSKSSYLYDLAVLHLPGVPGDFEPIRFHPVEDGRSSPAIGAEVLVAGSPSQELFTPDIEKKDRRFSAGSYALEAYVVEPREEVLARFDHEFDSSHHYLVDFETGGESKEYLQSPEGMSGAGIWLLPPPVPKDKVWDGTRVALVGIQTAWFRSAKLLKVTRVERLLELLKKSVSVSR